MLFDDKLARMREQQRQIRNDKQSGEWSKKIRDIQMTEDQQAELESAMQRVEEQALTDEMDSKDRLAIILAAYRVIMPAVIAILVIMLGLVYVMFSWPKWVS
ncbi:MAG: hypothetical protein IJA35_05135 [Clostridia bacterium]|nr:hypothetical protein [Clostridia bacterium]